MSNPKPRLVIHNARPVARAVPTRTPCFDDHIKDQQVRELYHDTLAEMYRIIRLH